MTEKYHFIGIGGIGMSGLAKILLTRNKEVTGSDIAPSYVTEGLMAAGATIHIGHASKHIIPPVTVVYSSDIKQDNPEFQNAKQLACPLWHRSEMLKHLMEGYQPLIVAGTHGKTTTTSLLACTLIEAGLDPSFAIGGIPQQLQTNAGHGNGKYFVAEGDESDGTFLNYAPFGGIVTNIDFDHMNFFLTETELIKAFKTFMLKVSSPEHLLWCGDDPRLTALGIDGISYGFGKQCILRAENIRQVGWKSYFDVLYEGDRHQNVEVALTGRHNVLNALAVFGLSLRLNIPVDRIRNAFKSFKGVKRRCEHKGEVNKVLVIDDYAHHPTEIYATLKAIRQAIGERRLIAVFQPHRYSRMKDCMGTFGQCFSPADELIVTDIFSSGENPIPGVTTDKIFEELSQNSTCQYVSRQYLNVKLSAFCCPHDVVVTLGAGDITKLGSELIQSFQNHSPRKLRLGLLTNSHELSIQSAKHLSQKKNGDIYTSKIFGISDQDNLVKMTSEVIEGLQECDLIIPLFEGQGAQEEHIQGFLKTLDLPIVGCDTTSAALCLNRVLSKQILLLRQLPAYAALDFDLYGWQSNTEVILEKIKEKISYPCFIQPVRDRKGAGKTRIENEKGLVNAIEKAFKYDYQVMIEKEVPGQPMHFSLFGNDKIAIFTSLGNHSQETLFKGLKLCAEIYRTLRCSGAALITLMLNEKKEFSFHEIYPFPKLHPESDFVKNCTENNLSFEELIDHLVILSLHFKRREKCHK